MPLILGTLASAAKNFLWAPAGAYDSLATVTLTSTATNIDFVGIPSGYKHLQLRYSAAATRATYAVNDPWIQFNNDFIDNNGNYSWHQLRGDGSAAAATAAASTWRVYAPGQMATNQGSGPAVGIIDILDYADTTKYKTARWLSGFDTNGTVAGYGGFIGLQSGSWRNTNAISSIRISSDYGPYLANSTFSLYGVK